MRDWDGFSVAQVIINLISRMQNYFSRDLKDWDGILLLLLLFDKPKLTNPFWNCLDCIFFYYSKTVFYFQRTIIAKTFDDWLKKKYNF